MTRAAIADSVRRVAGWVERSGYRGYEPFDGLSSPVAALARRSPLLERVLQQSVRRSPVNLRPLLGIAPKDSTKGRGYMAWGYLELYRTGEQRCAGLAEECLDWLTAHSSPGYAEACWGNHFDFVSRVGRLPAFEPIIVWTSLIGLVFLEAYRVLGRDRYLAVARSACAWVLGLPRERTATGDCLSYVAFEQRSIHNANLLGASLLAATGQITGESELLETAFHAMRYSCERQRPDGSWYYGEGAGLRWIDSFHTGYNLDSLHRYGEAAGGAFAGHLERGLSFFLGHFIEPDGRVRYYHDRLYPIDIQAVAQAVDTLVLLAGHRAACLELARRVAAWAVGELQDGDGHFYFRLTPWGRIKTPMLHWGQATMFKALACLLGSETREEAYRAS